MESCSQPEEPELVPLQQTDEANEEENVSSKIPPNPPQEFKSPRKRTHIKMIRKEPKTLDSKPPKKLVPKRICEPKSIDSIGLETLPVKIRGRPMIKKKNTTENENENEQKIEEKIEEKIPEKNEETNAEVIDIVPEPLLGEIKQVEEEKEVKIIVSQKRKSTTASRISTIDSSDLAKPSEQFLYQDEIAEIAKQSKKKKKKLKKKAKKIGENIALKARIEELENKLKEKKSEDMIADLESVIDEQNKLLEHVEEENKLLSRTIENLRSQQESLIVSDVNLAQEQRRSECLKSRVLELNDANAELRSLLQTKESEILGLRNIVDQLNFDEKATEDENDIEKAIHKMIQIFDSFVQERNEMMNQIEKEKKGRKILMSKVNELTEMLDGYERCNVDKKKAESRLSLSRDRISSLEQQCLKLTKENNALKKLALDNSRLAAREENKDLIKEINSLRKENRKLKSAKKVNSFYTPKVKIALDEISCSTVDSESPKKVHVKAAESD